MDAAILTVLIALLVYMIIRDIVISKKRRANRIMLKRISTKFDQLSKDTKTQSNLFNQLLNILSKYEDDGKL